MSPKVIEVPKTDPDAYNPNRAAGALLNAQAMHIREALKRRLQEFTALLEVDPAALKTEADVSAYIHKATALLHTHRRIPKDK